MIAKINELNIDLKNNVDFIMEMIQVKRKKF